MPVTVADIEADLVVMCGPYLRRAGLDATTVDGSNPSLRIPIRRALVRMGLTVDDVDEATTIHETLLDLTLLRTLELCRDNWAEVDQQAGEESQSLSQLTRALDDRIAALKEELGPIAVDPDSTQIPGGSVSGLIRRGRFYPPSLRPWYWDEYGNRCYH